jgi:hypothetical protein
LLPDSERDLAIHSLLLCVIAYTLCATMPTLLSFVMALTLLVGGHSIFHTAITSLLTAEVRPRRCVVLCRSGDAIGICYLWVVQASWQQQQQPSSSGATDHLSSATADRKGSVLGVSGALDGACRALAPLLGGVLFQFAEAMPYVVSALLTAVALALATLRLVAAGSSAAAVASTAGGGVR